MPPASISGEQRTCISGEIQSPSDMPLAADYQSLPIHKRVEKNGTYDCPDMAVFGVFVCWLGTGNHGGGNGKAAFYKPWHYQRSVLCDLWLWCVADHDFYSGASGDLAVSWQYDPCQSVGMDSRTSDRIVVSRTLVGLS